MANVNPKYEQKIESILRVMTSSPGVYQYFDEKGKIIYVGKAKNLKNRVSSYFNRDTQHGAKIQFLVGKIADIRIIVTNSELDALLLENNLIKKFQPRYNVLLKDDKTYPWICLKNEAFPRVFYTRNVIKDGSSYFGPYASGRMMHTMLDLIKQLYPLRNCKLNLSASNIQAKKYKRCLEFHIGNCLGPCEGLQTETDYLNDIQSVKSLLKGNISSIIKELKEKMMEFAAELEFEKAQKVKEKIKILENYQSKSTIVSSTIHNVDVFSIVSDAESGFINYLKVMNGAIVQAHSIELKKRLEETESELLSLGIVELRNRFFSDSKEVIIPFGIELEIPGVNFLIPQRGEKKQLLELSERNAKAFRIDQHKKHDLVDPERHTKRILAKMMTDLRMKEPPVHIECFDNSNIQGNFPVAACVVFKDTRPSKKDYRHFNIKTVEGPNDFASMEEIIFRRYTRMLQENQTLPQLVIIDGGKGQLSSAMNSFEKLGLKGKITVIGIAKKLEEIYFPGDSIPLYIDKTSETLKVIQQARDEAHRFGITHHRSKRDKTMRKTELSEINGIGEQTAQTLLKNFKSVKRIKEASLEELKNCVGEHRAKIIKHFFETTQ